MNVQVSIITIWKYFSKNMTSVCQQFSNNLPKICQQIETIWQKFVSNWTKISQKFWNNLKKKTKAELCQSQRRALLTGCNQQWLEIFGLRKKELCSSESTSGWNLFLRRKILQNNLFNKRSKRWGKFLWGKFGPTILFWQFANNLLKFFQFFL